MNRADFLNMIEGSTPVDRRMLSEVYELINIFPYFHSAHLLLLKGLQDSNDVKFENQLRSSAIHIANRELLYHYLKNDTTTEIVQTEISLPQNEEVKVESQGDAADSQDIMLIHENEKGSSDEILSLIEEDFIPAAGDDLLELIGDDELVEEITEAKPEVNDKNSRKQLQSALIDKFIITNPRIEPSREKTDLPVEDLSKHSNEESGVFVTDTLARIYVHQGYYSKAIDIYEKLSLKFPEKSSYFATQIEKVKEYLKK
jgi:hypothetical protein